MSCLVIVHISKLTNIGLSILHLKSLRPIAHHNFEETLTMSLTTVSHDQMLSTIKKSTEALLQGFHSSNIEDLLPGASETFVYHIHPATSGFSPMTRKEFLHFWESFMMPNLANFEADVHTLSFDVENRRATIFLSSTADTPLGKGTWKNDAVFMPQFAEDGKTLLRVDEL